MVKTRKNRGGKVIASGGYGCVFNPPLKCANNITTAQNSISKLMTKDHAIQEFNEIKEIKNKLQNIKNYKDYFLIYNIQICQPSKLTTDDLTSFKEKCSALPKDEITATNINNKLDEVMALNIPNGGLPVDDYIFKNIGYDNLYKTHIALVHLLKNGIMPMNKNYIYHSDIKDSNILIDNSEPSQLKARLIDWGLTVDYPNINEPLPNNWKNRPLQFNVPFSVIIFTNLFNTRYTEYLNKGGKLLKDDLYTFVLGYLKEWIKERGAGHYKFINEIFYLLYNSTLINITEKDKPFIIETQKTIPHIVYYIVEILLHYTDIKTNTFNLREYLTNVYIHIVDIWGFITTYYPFLEAFSNNYKYLTDDELEIFKQLSYIFKEYLYNPRVEAINKAYLFKDLKLLGNLIRKLSNIPKINSSIKKTIKISSVFKKKKFKKRFKNPFILSLK